jgi:hypothetical protein
MTKMKYTREHWDEFQRLVATGVGANAALRELDIPSGTLGSLKVRFGSREPAALLIEPTSPSVPSQSIGELAKMLNNYTEELLELATQMSELTKHAHGLALLDDTLGQLEAKQREARGLRNSLEAAESKLVSRAMVVHSND